MRKSFLTICILLLGISLQARPKVSASLEDTIPTSGNVLRLSLITCAPGPEIFELYGHEAIRVQGSVANRPVDAVFNYGVFDFASPGFVYRFVKGETDYYADAVPTAYFIESYRNRGSKVTEYTLDLSPDEADALFARLLHDIEPQNKTYRYKYFSTNCATRILDNIDSITGGPIKYPRPHAASNVTYRKMLRELNAGYPWYQLGIDLALGSYIDRPVDPRQQSFAPTRLAEFMESIRRTDGRPLVSETHTLYPGAGDMRLSPTPFLLSPTFVFIVITLGVIGALCLYIKRNKIPRGIWAFWGILCGLPGCVIWFLIFCTTHEGTSPNYLALWLNPFWLMLPCLIWSRKLLSAIRIFFIVQGLAAITLLIILICGVQDSNPALMPPLATTILLAIQAQLILSRHRASLHMKTPLR